MPNELYGTHFIERQRSSGYKSTTYAMAEIVDNSIDAKANDVRIILSESDTHTGKQIRSSLNRIFFLDNGNGMTLSELNNCLTFSEGKGRSNERIGSFGVGLPNSSISVCRRLEVYTKIGNKWHYVYLDVDEQLQKDEAVYEAAIEKNPISEFEELTEENVIDINTIVVWQDLDRLDVARASTLNRRASKLLGRIYRYKILNNLNLKIINYSQDRNNVDTVAISVIPYDPLFITKEKTYITKHIWKWAYEEDPKGKVPELSDNHEFNSMHHYRKFVEGCKENETNKPLFQKLDDAWDVKHKINLNGKTYTWKIRASFASSSIANPGIRSGGGTNLGKMFGEKMSGSTHFKSANIYFIRANREIDFGSYGLYTVTDEKNRFWTIEIHFDSDLDELMGISNNKQSVSFKYISDSDLGVIPFDKNSPLGVQREILWNQMSEKILDAIKKMKKKLSEYASQFRIKKEAEINKKEGISNPIPQIESAVIERLPIGEKWSEDQIDETTKFLKERYMMISKNEIKHQVENYTRGLCQHIVLYAPNETGNLFEFAERRDKQITLINSNHEYYKNIIEPLKTHPKLKIFAISIEMLLSSFAFEMHRLLLHEPDTYNIPLNNYMKYTSIRLNEFIQKAQLRINPDHADE